MMHSCPVIWIRSARKIGNYVAHQSNAIKMTEDQSRASVRRIQSRGDRKLAREESARPRSINYEGGSDGELPAATRSREHRAVGREIRCRQLNIVAVLNPGGNCFAHEVVIHVRPEPMRVSDRIVGARGDEQSLRIQSTILKGAARMMSIKREPAF